MRPAPSQPDLITIYISQTRATIASCTFPLMELFSINGARLQILPLGLLPLEPSTNPGVWQWDQMAPYMLPTHGIIVCRNSTKMVIRSRPGVNTVSPLQKFQNLLVTYGDPAGLQWIQKDKSLLQILAINAL